MGWTTPKTFEPAEPLTAGELNTHVRDNTAYLYQCKYGVVGRLAALSVPHQVWTGVQWDFVAEQSVPMWNPALKERVYPGIPGVWLVSAMIRWSPLVGSSGSRSVRIQKNGTVPVGQVRETFRSNSTQFLTATAMVRIGGDDYLYVDVWQDTGGVDTLEANLDRSFSLAWLGA